MSNVTLTIGGRTFSVACADGEERHIEALGRVIDSKVHALGDSAGQNEVRMLLYAALVLADELHEAKCSVEQAVPQSAAFFGTGAPPEQLERIAETLENLAAHLEGRASSP